MLKISKFTTGMLDTNVYFCYDTDSHKCVIIDPADHADHIINIIENELEVKPSVILLTHAHFDHMLAARELGSHYGIKIYVNVLDGAHMEDSKYNLSEEFSSGMSFTADEYETFKDGDILRFIDRDFKVIGTPGHTPGSSCFYIEDGLTYVPEGETEARICPVLFSGDTLFRFSYGRTDFPGGELSEIYRSIKDKLLVLPKETTVFPGHGSQTGIALEQRYNPVVR